ncbi:MAG: hypothetical protein ACXAAH_00200, partial [Promethearchaeota archaeon]
MKECIKLFKSLPVKNQLSGYSFRYINYGVIVSNSIIDEYLDEEIILYINKLVPSNESLNKTFHKSWKKIVES